MKQESTSKEFQNMEAQPTEILEQFFKLLPSVQDLQKCANTCLRWKQTIEKMTKDKNSRILVAGGQCNSERRSSFEILDFLNPRFQNDVFFDDRLVQSRLMPHMGGVLKNQPILFGERIKKKIITRDYSQSLIELECFVLGDSGLKLPPIKEDEKVNREKCVQSSVVLNEDTLWITGLTCSVRNTIFVSLDLSLIHI